MIEIIEAIIKKKGKKHQIVKAIEELNELSTILAQSITKDVNKEKIIDEISDVLIMGIQIQKIFNIDPDTITVRMIQKLMRLKDREQL